MRLSRSCLVSSDTGHRRFETSLRSTRLQGLPEVGPARLLAAMLGDLGVSTLCLIKTMNQFSSFFEHQTSHVVCFNAQGLLWVRLRRPLVFFIVPTCWEICFSSLRCSIYFCFLSLFWIIIPAILPPRWWDTTLWVHLRCPLDFFIVISIYWKSASYRSSLDLPSFGKTTDRSAAKLTCSFFFWTDVHAIRHVDGFKTSSWPSLDAPTNRSGACETWVPLGPHRPGPRPSPTSGSGLLEDQPTCQ
jgi:hypothetical protein